MISPWDKTSQALLFLERISPFLDLDCQNLATLNFDNCPISENEISLAEKKLCLQVFLPLSNHFPAIGNYYSFLSLFFPIRVDQKIFFPEKCSSRGIFNWYFTVGKRMVIYKQTAFQFCSRNGKRSYLHTGVFSTFAIQ